MTDKNMIDAAFQTGFNAAVVIKTEDIHFDFAFRRYCEENICGQYGENYSCPPDCGTCEEMQSRILSKKRALVVQSVNRIKDFTAPEIERSKKRHCGFAIELEKRLKISGIEGFTVGACGCTLCDPCAKKLNAPCRFPEHRYSCMSAYCINAKALCENCGFSYNLSPDLALFGMFVFD